MAKNDNGLYGCVWADVSKFWYDFYRRIVAKKKRGQMSSLQIKKINFKVKFNLKMYGSFSKEMGK